MTNLDVMLCDAKEAVKKCLWILASSEKKIEECTLDKDIPREFKAPIDLTLERMLVQSLCNTGLPILSEESGLINNSLGHDYCWIIDPLDGTVNFIRGIGPSGISVALCYRGLPVFGVIGMYPSMQLAWGGKQYGAFIDSEPINVSLIRDKNKSIICAGLPSRFDYSEENIASYLSIVCRFGKVRMIGAASISLIQVALGCAEAYFEKEIMIWDVAAGLAIVEGAGGVVKMTLGSYENSKEIFVSNGNFQI